MISFYELIPPVVNFVKFLENIEKVVKDKMLSICIITNARTDQKSSIQDMLSRLEKEIPKYSKKINQIK